MRCLAVLVDIDNPTIDNVILWEDEGRPVAIAYNDGQIIMTRPLTVNMYDESVEETKAAFQINEARITRITTWMPA